MKCSIIQCYNFMSLSYLVSLNFVVCYNDNMIIHDEISHLYSMNFNKTNKITKIKKKKK